MHNLQEHESLTITNGGFVLAESAPKYPDDSHQAYHLHTNKETMRLKYTFTVLEIIKSTNVKNYSGILRFLNGTWTVLLGHLRRKQFLPAIRSVWINEILWIFILRSFLPLFFLSLLCSIWGCLCLSHIQQAFHLLDVWIICSVIYRLVSIIIEPGA